MSFRPPNASASTPSAAQSASLLGHVGSLFTVGWDPLDAPLCFLWRTDPQRVQGSVFLPILACDVADLYHLRGVVHLPELPGLPLEVVWLELACDDTLSVFLSPVKEGLRVAAMPY